MNHDAAQAALESLKEGEEHYSVECPRCRRVNKVTVQQLKRALPRAAAEHGESAGE